MCFTVLGSCLMYKKDWSSMLQNLNFHISLTCRSLSSILSARYWIYFKLVQAWLGMSCELQHLLRAGLWPMCPLLHTQEDCPTVFKGQIIFALAFKICYAAFGIKCLSLHKREIQQNSTLERKKHLKDLWKPQKAKGYSRLYSLRKLFHQGSMSAPHQGRRSWGEREAKDTLAKNIYTSFASSLREEQEEQDFFLIVSETLWFKVVLFFIFPSCRTLMNTTMSQLAICIRVNN